MNKNLLIGLILVVVLGFYGMNVNNSLVEQQERVNQSWAQVENQYQRRADLIPNLVNTVEGAADFESETLNEVTEARSRATSIQVDAGDLENPEQVAAFRQAQEELSGALSRLLATVEDYPELQANQNFRDLQTQLEGTENRISTERMRFNEAVSTYNTSIRQFPKSMFAGILGFDQKAYFEADEGADEAPEVNFD